ncbi:uncharacterized protein LOC103573779 isoform X2 [Microplitis demolitor]|uniref:uncharacterized protein LOC103573779 isoform X2 n=1 Tax=Microplitis demolitor TaxID=69319 RepID=UPI0004CCAD0A|nr:uncharacterized protein LOC103573779 isoform X2 [Microplitis demolitor]
MDENDVYVYGPETPVYYPEIIRYFIKVDVKRNIFPEKKTQHSKDSGVLFPKVAIITDNVSYKKYGESKLIERSQIIINWINSFFSWADTSPAVEVLLQGLIIMPAKGIYDPEPSSIYDIGFIHNDILTQKHIVEASTENGPSTEYVNAQSELRKVTEWFNENKNRFENMDANILLYLSPYHLADSTNPLSTANIVMGLSRGYVCSTTASVIISDLIGDNHAAIPLAVSSTLRMSHPQDRDDSKYFSSTFFIPESVKEDWRRRLKQAVQVNAENNNYECLIEPDEY